MGIPAGRRHRCFERDGWRCVKCGASENLTCDHVIPKSLGGKNWLRNLQTMCLPCNQLKGAKIEQYTKYSRTRKLVEQYLMAAGVSSP